MLKTPYIGGNMRKFIITSIIFIITLLSACGKKENPIEILKLKIQLNHLKILDLKILVKIIMILLLINQLILTMRNNKPCSDMVGFLLFTLLV